MTTVEGSAPKAVDLDIGGMTCASCAARIEKRLNRIDGVHATVNYATERAHAVLPAGVNAEELIAQVVAIGYSAHLPRPVPSRSDQGAARPPDDDDATHQLLVRVVVSALLSAPVLVLAMVSAFQFRNWQWLSLTLAAPVVVWGGAPFHRAAWANLRHHAATMDTLISLGTLAAFGWSLYALFFGDAGMPGMKMRFTL
ncbi:MAG TPA: cation transporter, partial [Acidimicrobiia bacterium]